MTEWILALVDETWSILLEMAPYLILGFFLAGLLSVIIRQDLIERWLGKQSFGSVVKASLFGVPLPLCSCGVIPVTSSLYQRGASKGATTSFLTSTPQTGVDSILATAGLISPLFAGIRVIVALVSGIITGLLVDLFEPSKPEREDIISTVSEVPSESAKAKIYEVFRYGFYTLPHDIGKTLILGIFLAGLLSAILPENWGESYLGNPWLTYLAVTLVAIPLYVCSTGSIPIAFVLMSTGVSPGAALVFLIAGPATNVATVTTLLKILGRRTITIYLISIIVISWSSGWIVDVFGSVLLIDITQQHHQIIGHSTLQIVSGLALILMVTLGWLYPIFENTNKASIGRDNSSLAIRVEGMTCSHCAKHVEEALISIPGVRTAQADATKNLAWIQGDKIDTQVLRSAIDKAGFDFKGFT